MKEIIHEWGCVHNPSYGGSCTPCRCKELEVNKQKIYEPVVSLWSRLRTFVKSEYAYWNTWRGRERHP